MAPWLIDRSSLGINKSGSTSSSTPRPVHLVQAPNGELNEKERGSSSSMAKGWSLGQAILSEYRRSRPASLGSRSTKSTIRAPDARPVSYTHLRAHETRHDLVCRLLLEKK